MDSENFNISVDSDWHANYDSANLQATVRQNYNEIDDRICLGDVLQYRATQTNESEFHYWNDELLVLGNHDMISAPSGWDWYVQPTSKQAYERWYEPYIETNGITIEPNTLYWYKEYEEKNILLIGGYCMFNNSEDREKQYQFFRRMLAYALMKNRSVMIAYHWTFADMRVIHCSFTNAKALDEMNGHNSVMPELYEYEQRLHDLVETAIDNGLDFVCWLNGHRHTDEIVIKDRQLHIMIGSTLYDDGNRVLRIDGTKTEALMNVVSYTADGNIEIRRYGANERTYGGLRKYLCITKRGEIIVDYGHLGGVE